MSVLPRRKVSSVTLVPQNKAIPFKVNNQRIEFDLKEVNRAPDDSIQLKKVTLYFQNAT
jgi:hypothetical protein